MKNGGPGAAEAVRRAEKRGILVMGLNGCGKSTVGKALAEKIGWRFMDAEDFYFP
ncbi:MAG: hypothetical protein J5602_05975, partial [Clostridia bacterium]|nr:hypothetical protein [Clostridia bacterium]